MTAKEIGVEEFLRVAERDKVMMLKEMGYTKSVALKTYKSYWANKGRPDE